MRNDAINMEVNEGLLAFFAEEEGAVGGVVHEEVFGEDGGAGGVAEDVEVGFLVGGRHRQDAGSGHHRPECKVFHNTPF